MNGGGPQAGGRRTLGSRQLRARRYLRADLSVDEFFDELNRREVRYVVLRWFDSLPLVEPGEDIDLLVADEDIDLVGELLTSPVLPPRRQKFDVYTVSGLPGSDHRGIPYFTPELANSLLDRSVLLRGRYRVPSPADHFDSLAYHAVYHKGQGSGLPATAVGAPAAEAGEHDYAAVLADLAEVVGLSVPLTLKGLDGYLAERKLRPPLDTLDKLSAWNPWLHEHLEDEFGPPDAGLPGLAVFVLRERAGHLLGMLCDELLREGWEPLETISLDPASAARVGAAVRGGNWEKGPWTISGGGPAAYVIAYDLGCSTGVRSGRTDSERVIASKVAVRRRLIAAMPAGPRFNPLHSSDNPRQALDYLGLLHDAGVVARLRDRVDQIRADMSFPYPVVEVLPSGQRRAVVAVVQHPVHGECVCKLFYSSAERFRLRELRARTEFGWLPEVPALLEAGSNWLLTPRYGDTRAHVRRRLPGLVRNQLTPQAARALARMARALHEHGTFLLDLTPQNVLTDPRAGLKVMDWEFLQDFPGEPPDLLASPTVVGRAVGLPGVDVPIGADSNGGSRITVFHPTVTGIPARLLFGTPSGTRALLMESGMFAVAVQRLLRTGAREVRAAVRDELRPLARRGAKKVLAGLLDVVARVGGRSA